MLQEFKAKNKYIYISLYERISEECYIFEVNSFNIFVIKNKYDILKFYNFYGKNFSLFAKIRGNSIKLCTKKLINKKLLILK